MSERDGNRNKALAIIFNILPAEPDDLCVTYFGARLARDVGRDDLPQVMLFQTCTRAGIEPVYYREYPSPPALPNH